MALVVGSATVATGMSPIVEAGLYADEIFIDGVTFTSKYNIGNAGQIQVEKYADGTGVEPAAPGSNFTDREYANTVININCNNGFQDSAKVPAYFEATMPTNVLMNKTLEVTKKIRTGRQQSGLAALINGASGVDIGELTTENLKTKLLNVRKALRNKHAKPDVVLASVETYSAMLEIAGKSYTPLYNDEVERAGRVGTWMGMIWIEADLLVTEGEDYKFLKDDGTAETVNTENVAFIMYDHNAYSIIDRLDGLRVKDSEEFFGSKVQGEIATGFRVTNANCVAVGVTTETLDSALTYELVPYADIAVSGSGNGG